MFPEHIVQIRTKNAAADQPMTGCERARLRDRSLREQVLHIVEGPAPPRNVKDHLVRLIVRLKREIVHAHDVVATLARGRIRARLPENYAQLDAIPADQVVEFVLGVLDDPDRDELLKLYPRCFWTDAHGRKEGKRTGFAFMLFALGIVRDKRVSSKGRTRREKHFLGQFRDCQHIEAASRCAAFITFDKAAARLAKATYAYAGGATQVICLEIRET